MAFHCFVCPCLRAGFFEVQSIAVLIATFVLRNTVTPVIGHSWTQLGIDREGASNQVARRGCAQVRLQQSNQRLRSCWSLGTGSDLFLADGCLWSEASTLDFNYE